jgi:hypothetical protein
MKLVMKRTKIIKGQYFFINLKSGTDQKHTEGACKTINGNADKTLDQQDGGHKYK